ncbi:MAG: glycoside hydrolase family 15 [Rubrobacter sp.]|nr:glycoside hydrolase family 15 [Rubrobacter sp.]
MSSTFSGGLHQRYPAVAVLVLALAALSGSVGPEPAPAGDEGPGPAPLRAAGLIGDQSSPGSVSPVPPERARGASYLPGSNVLRLADGSLLHLPPGASEGVASPEPDARTEAQVRESRAWLDRGLVPGESVAERRVAERALLDLRLLTRPGGAAIASLYPRWDHVWPRDASWFSVAFSTTGHREEALSILRFLADVQSPDGTWEARYHPDGSPVFDGRRPQLDGNGWFLWAVWYWSVTGPGTPEDREHLRELWPVVEKAAGAAAGRLRPGGLPPPGPDYWETDTRLPNLGTAAPLRTGLRAAADLAARLGHPAEARRYGAAAVRLDAAIGREFGPAGYSRTPRPGSGADSAVNFLALPFAPPDPGVERAIDRAAADLATPAGGVVPGEAFPDEKVAWTPSTAFFALSAAASGDREAADRRLGWLSGHRTQLGAFPEKVSAEGEPLSVAPLGWTAAIFLLALSAREQPLPVPPVPPPEDRWMP